MTPHEAGEGLERLLTETIAATGIALTSVEVPTRRLPIEPRPPGATGLFALRPRRGRRLCDLPAPAAEVFAAFREVWRRAGYEVHDHGTDPPTLVAGDPRGNLLTLRHAADGQLLLTASTPPTTVPAPITAAPGSVGATMSAAAPMPAIAHPPTLSLRQERWRWWIGFAIGVTPQALLLTLLVTYAADQEPGIDRQLTALYGIPNLVVASALLAAGFALLTSPSTRPAGNGMLTGTAVLAILFTCTCLPVANSGPV